MRNRFHSTLPFLSILLLTAMVLTAPALMAQPPQDYDIYSFNPRTGAVNQVTDIANRGEFNPSQSPFAHAIVHDVVAFDAPIHDLYITLVHSRLSVPLPGGEGGNDASWSPSGLLIAFDRLTSVDFDPSIYYVSVLGGARRLIRENAIDVDWSPLGFRVVFTDFNDFSVRTKSLISGRETIVAQFGLNPVWSPNGRYIAYSDGNNLFRQRVDLGGNPIGSEEQITFDDPMNTFNQQPSWSANSRKLIFHSNRGGADFDIWKVPANGSAPPTLVTGAPGAGDFDPNVSGFGNIITFAGFTEPPAPLARASYRLEQNYPNPFTNVTRVEFELPEASLVELDVYSHTGQHIKTLINSIFEAGVHEINWDGIKDNKMKAAPGIYLYTLRAGSFTETKMIALR